MSMRLKNWDIKGEVHQGNYPEEKSHLSIDVYILN